MVGILKGNIPKQLDGDVVVVLGGKNKTVLFVDPNDLDAKGNPKPIKTSAPSKGIYGDGGQTGSKSTGGEVIVKDFTYFRVKKAGKKYDKKNYRRELRREVMKSIPRTFNTDFLFRDAYKTKHRDGSGALKDKKSDMRKKMDKRRMRNKNGYKDSPEFQRLLGKFK